MKRRIRRLLVTAASLVLTVLVLSSLVAVGLLVGERAQHRLPKTADPVATAHSVPSVAEASRPIVVAFVVGSSGTVASDLLAPYDVLASSRAVTAYVVAADARPAILDGGPAVLPTYTFDQVDADPSLTPGLVVVPAVDDPDGPSEGRLRKWLAERYDTGARVLGICAGARLLAATGILDGRSATSHWSRLPALERSHPEVHWVRGQRWVDDGPVTTTAAITSGVPGSLHVLSGLAGRDEARRVATHFAEFGWGPSQPAAIARDGWRGRDWPVVLNLVEPWHLPAIGVRLHDGVSELEAAAPFEVYSQSGAGRAIALSDEGAVQTKHGLVLLTTDRYSAPALARVVKPSGFRTALAELAQHTNQGTAVSTAKMMGYTAPFTTASTDVDGGPVWRPLLSGVGSVALALAIGRAPILLSRRRRREHARTAVDKPRQDRQGTEP
jgi:putative intracellular protease/amidase